MSNKAMDWAVKCGVGKSHKLILMLLANAHNGQTGACFPSQQWLIDTTQLGESSVQQILKDLEAWKLIARHTERLGRGKGSRTDFALNLDVLDPQKTPAKKKLDPQPTGAVKKLDPQKTGLTPPENAPLDPQPTGGVLKEEPEENRNINPNASTPAWKVFNFYNTQAKLSGWIVHAKLTEAIRKPLNARIEEYGPKEVCRFIIALSKQDWTSHGFKENPGFRASLAYITRPRTFAEHFDKLVTSVPPEDLLSHGAGPRGDRKESTIEFLFRTFADTGVWHGERHGHFHKPDSPRAKYDPKLYAKFKLAPPGGQA